MRSPSSLHPMLRSILALAFVAGFEGCGGGDGPLDPASGSTAEPTAQSAASSPVPAQGLANLTTSQRIVFGSSYISTVYKMDHPGLPARGDLDAFARRACTGLVLGQHEAGDGVASDDQRRDAR